MRSDLVIALRPDLKLESSSGELSMENFQNTVLRPILKFQNVVTLYLLKQDKHFEISDIEQGPDKGEQMIRDILQKNKIFRNQLIGMVLGLMTEERIVQLQLTRFVDQLLGS